MTPNLAIVHIQNPHWKGFRLWIPLFLLWIPLIILSPLIFLIVFGCCVAAGINFWQAITAFWNLICSLPGMVIRVRSQGNQVLVRVC